MIDNIYDHFGINDIKSQGIDLDEEQTAVVRGIFKTIEIKKDMFFIQEGEKSTQIGMVLKGILRSFCIDEKGNDITKYFYTEGAKIFSYAAYLAQKESSYSIQALEDCEILVAKISDFERIVDGNYQLLLFFKKILDNILVMKEHHANSFVLLNSVDRYKQFLVEYPGLEKRVKQHQLASYLGITPVSLSRIRRKLNLIK
jgi:CRP-like cAMP-binding protein